MRRAILVVALLLVMALIASAIYGAYTNHREELNMDYMVSNKRVLRADGYFQGRFRCKKNGREICGYDYQIDGKNLYITVLVTAGDNDILPVDEYGFVTISFYVGNDIENIYYRADGESLSLKFTQE